jgi:hypothetical protein
VRSSIGRVGPHGPAGLPAGLHAVVSAAAIADYVALLQREADDGPA